MMNYDEFKMALQENLQKEYIGAQIAVESVNQINRTVEVMVIHMERPCAEQGMYLPSIDLEDWFAEYEKTGESSIGNIYKKITDFLADETVCLRRSDCTDNNDGKNDLFITLVNAEMNKDLLKDVPHRVFLDLAIICRKRIKIKEKEDYIASLTVTNDLLARWNITEDELFEMAAENTRKNYLTETFSLSAISGLLCPDSQGMGENCAYDMEVVTNKRKYEGAVNALVFHDGLREIADKMDSDLFILPSSRHEVLCISSELGDVESLYEMVRSVNDDPAFISQKDILSNNVYYYDRENDEISIAEC